MENTRPLTTRFPQSALITLFSGAVAISFAPILVRLSEVGPIATAFWRLTLALPVLWVALTVGNQSTAVRRPNSFSDYRRLSVAGLFFAANLAVLNWAINLTSVANATLLDNLAPIFVTLGAWFLFRQRVTPVFSVGMLLALSGAAMLIGQSFALNIEHLWGDLLGVFSASLYGGYILAVKNLRHNFSTATVMAWSGVSASLALLLLTIVSGEPLLGSVTWHGWFVLLALAIVVHAGGQGLIAQALAHLPAAFSAVGLLLQPALAALLAWGLLDEALGPTQALGGIIILAGIILARKGS